jgi:hypothetical protein
MGSKSDVKWRVLGAAFVITTLAYPSVGVGSGYLAGHEVDFHTFLPGPPPVDSLLDSCQPLAARSIKKLRRRSSSCWIGRSMMWTPLRRPPKIIFTGHARFSACSY